MPPLPPPSPRHAAVSAAIARVDWAALTKDLVRYAFSQCREQAMAEDVAHEALRRLLEPASAWDPAADPDPKKWLLDAIKSIVWNERTSARVRKNVPLDPSGPKEEPDESLHPPDPRAPDEARLVDADLFARRLAFVRRDRARDAEALLMLELTLDGWDAPADAAQRTGMSYEAVIAARKRLQRAGAAAKEAIPDDDEPPSRPDAVSGREADEDSMEVA